MAGITLEQAQAQLDSALAALEDARTKQSYTISSTSGGRTMGRALLSSLSTDVEKWERRVSQLQRGNKLACQSAVPL